MDMSRIALFSVAEQRLAWTDRRQTMLAENIANADTPGWQPREVTPFAKLISGAQAALAPVRTAPGHLPGLAPEVLAARAAKGERAPDGNGVKLDEQLGKVADTESIHDLTSNLYMKYLGFFKTAIGK
jgi:flagellar basal-body rod protein FlgB